MFRVHNTTHHQHRVILITRCWWCEVLCWLNKAPHAIKQPPVPPFFVPGTQHLAPPTSSYQGPTAPPKSPKYKLCSAGFSIDLLCLFSISIPLNVLLFKFFLMSGCCCLFARDTCFKKASDAIKQPPVPAIFVPGTQHLAPPTSSYFNNWFSVVRGVVLVAQGTTRN